MESGTTSATTTSTTMKKYSSSSSNSERSNVLHVSIRFVTLTTSLLACCFMVSANEEGFASLYGFRLPIKSNWSYSFSYQYLVGIAIAASGHSLLQLIIGGSRLLRGTPLIPSRTQAWLIFLGDQVFAYLMLSAGSAASGVTNLNRTGIKHTPLPNFCKPLRIFCEHVAASVIFTFFGSFFLAASAIQQVIWLSKN
ncbi:hypothetical protein ACFE04_008496 [Oxalis oulophora]